MSKWTKPAHSWADVTLAEYAALDLVRDADAVRNIDLYWQCMFDAGAYPFEDEAPRLSDRAGEAFAEWADRLTRVGHDSWASAVLAREVLGQLGTLTVMQYRQAVPA